MKPAGRFRSGLRARFVAVAGLLITTTVVSGLYSMVSFSRLQAMVEESLRDSEAVTTTIADLTGSLQQEDDALLLHASDERSGEIALANARQSSDAGLMGLAALLERPGESSQVREVGRRIDAYRASADRLMADETLGGELERHHHDVNPLLRRAVAGAVEIRNHHFKRMQEVTERARDEARRSILVVSAVSIVALLLSIAVVVHLARAIVWPLRALGSSAEAIRQGDFDRRTPVLSNDELGRLADCMNRMAAELAEVRRMNIREVIRAKRTLEATIAALPDAILVVDTTGVISSANQAAAALLSRDAGNGPRSIDDVLLHPKTRAAFRQALAGVVGDEHELSPHATVSLQVAGEVRHFVPRVVPIGAGTPEASGAVLVLNDVTEFVRLSERRVELVAVTSHELRTPLTTLRMTLMMLREGTVVIGRRAEELVAAALMGVDQLVGIVDEFLDLARIEAGELRLSYGRVDLSELAAEVGRSFVHRCEEVGVALRIEPPKNPIEVWGDSRRLRAVLANLVDNAVKYTPRGGTIRVRTGLHSSPPAASAPPRVEVMVSDTGPGVRPEFRDRIFEKFFRVEQLKPDGGRGVRGSGIGLYLARQIVEAHAGTIACTSGGDEGGAHIGFVLPVEPPRVVVSES